jgi:hypothetical protein
VRLLVPLGACALLVSACGGSLKHGSSSAAAPPSTTGTPAGASTGSSASASAGTGRTVTASAGGVTATLIASTHTPRANSTWPLRFTVTRAGRPARASVSYEYLFSGQVVARRSHYTFSGSFHDTFVWPSTAVGYPLTFRAVIVAGGASINLDYPVQVSG